MRIIPAEKWILMFKRCGRRRCRPRRPIIVLGQAAKKAGGYCPSLSFVFANLNIVYQRFATKSRRTHDSLSENPLPVGMPGSKKVLVFVI